MAKQISYGFSSNRDPSVQHVLQPYKHMILISEIFFVDAFWWKVKDMYRGKEFEVSLTFSFRTSKFTIQPFLEQMKPFGIKCLMRKVY